ncbi:MAG: galactose mutarotase, partial [Oscillospiraceae bacterium]|nr:galactose mutarotase [Oscillospiraceae bacterium]
MVTARPFGVTRHGEPVTEYTLTNAAGMQVRCLDWGGHVTAVLVPDRAGRMVDVVLGFDTVAEYERDEAFLGAFVGRFANRIEKAAFELDGVHYALEVNNGPNHNHGVWHLKPAAETEYDPAGSSITFRYDSPDGEDGFPGNVTAWLTYRLEEANALTIEYRAVTDRATPINLTNHSYFNLAGGGDVLDHRLTLHAARFTPADEYSCPYGTVEPVAGTPMDFTAEKPIGRDIDADYDQLVWGRGYDHNWCVDGTPGTLRPAAEAWCEATG